MLVLNPPNQGVYKMLCLLNSKPVSLPYNSPPYCRPQCQYNMSLLLIVFAAIRITFRFLSMEFPLGGSRKIPCELSWVCLFSHIHQSNPAIIESQKMFKFLFSEVFTGGNDMMCKLYSKITTEKENREGKNR